MLQYLWEFWARPNQLCPKGLDWSVWLILAGRGFGKTLAGAQEVRRRVENGLAGRIGLIGETAADVRDVMVEGESGILAISPPWFRPVYQPSKRRLVWPNGAIATTFSGDAPDQLRGPQFDFVWADEPAKWKYPDKAWDNMEFGLRLGPHPQVVATTTPRPIELIKVLVADNYEEFTDGRRGETIVTSGSTFENIANLSPKFIRRTVKKYVGTRLGRQELFAQILGDMPGALWTQTLIDKYRVAICPRVVRIVVGVDPEASSEEAAAETGIIVCALGENGHGYVLHDGTVQGTPGVWATEVVKTWHLFKADLVVGEVNNGGDMVGYTIASIFPNVPFKAVHASHSKEVRAEPISSLYEQGRIHHVGQYADLESQLTSWIPRRGMKSPDRLDAMVWAFTELFLEPEEDEDWYEMETERASVGAY